MRRFEGEAKQALLVQLDAIASEIGEMEGLMGWVTETLRPVDDVETDVWCQVEYSRTRLEDLASRIEHVRRDAVTDLPD